jgi:ssDNA thymidine ADP-ribosyltransferase, DarT
MTKMLNLNPDRALIFRITHVANVPWILANGLHCSNSGHSDPHYVPIGNSEIITRRATRVVPVTPGGTLSDYVPFYFTPHSPMLLNIKTGRNGVIRRPMSEIAVLVSSLHEIQKHTIPFVFTDRHALYQAAEFHVTLDRLDRIDWPRLQNRDFKHDPDEPKKVERYQAEALVHRHVPMAAILGIICYESGEQTKIETICDTLKVTPKVLCRPDWYF